MASTEPEATPGATPGATPEPKYRLYYWPLPFRGCFVSYLFAYRNEPLLMSADFDEIGELMSLPPAEQPIPFLGPPVLQSLNADWALSQMPAIVMHVARELDLLPEDPVDQTMGLKILMDCNDLLMEICRYNGSMMWERTEWQQFRSERLPRWMRIFENSLSRGYLGGAVTFADIAVYALFGNMIRCLPTLEPDLLTHAPGIRALCERIGAQPSLAAHVAEEAGRYGDLYCGGQIEASIRAMLAEDVAERAP
ncbi:MAG: glutathione S-transferase family protein [Pseudomonadota bacterium]